MKWKQLLAAVIVVTMASMVHAQRNSDHDPRSDSLADVDTAEPTIESQPYYEPIENAGYGNAAFGYHEPKGMGFMGACCEYPSPCSQNLWNGYNPDQCYYPSLCDHLRGWWDSHHCASKKFDFCGFMTSSQKSCSQKVPSQKSCSQKVPCQKPCSQKAPCQKAPCQKTHSQKAPCQKTYSQKAPCPKTYSQKAPCQKTICQKVPYHKPCSQKAPCPKVYSQKAPCQKTISQKIPYQKPCSQKAPCQKFPSQKTCSQKVSCQKVPSQKSCAPTCIEPKGKGHCGITGHCHAWKDKMCGWLDGLKHSHFGHGYSDKGGKKGSVVHDGGNGFLSDPTPPVPYIPNEDIDPPPVAPSDDQPVILDRAADYTDLTPSVFPGDRSANKTLRRLPPVSISL